MRIAVATAVACLTTFGLSAAQDVQAAVKKQTTIPAQGLGPALRQLAKERDVQLVYRSEVVGSRQTGGATGELTFEEALRSLLEGTGLTFQYLDEKAITIVPLAKSSALERGDKLTLWERLHLAQLDQADRVQMAQAIDPSGMTQLPGSGAAAANLEEIIVTAQKRSERLQDVPVPVTALSATQLVDNNQLRLQDYYTSVPGFMVAPSSKQASQFLAIRGVTTGNGSPSVGVLIDDVPYGSSTYLGGGQSVPDLDPGDLQQIEVLRGPQGTLYGASSLGGLVKYVTVDPSMDALSGRIQLGASSVHNADDPGYNVRASINIPLSDTFAMRASGFTRLDAGYVDNPARGIEGINDDRTSGGRLSAMWRPSESLSLKLNAMYQKGERDGNGVVDLLPGLGELEQSALLDTSNEREAQSYSAILNADLGAAQLTALSGYNINSFSDTQDITYQFGDFTELFYGVRGTTLPSAGETRKFTQEVRVALPLGERVDWLVGVFYTKEDTDFSVDILAVDEATRQTVDAFVYTTFPSTFREYAAFTNLTFQITDRFDVQVGARYSDIKQHATELDEGEVWNVAFNGRPDPFFASPPDLNADAFTYLITPRFKITPDIMMYARMASGYRAGGVNITAGPGVPSGYDPDQTQNYEIGLKGEFFDRTLSVDASMYYIDWKDIQLNLAAPSQAAYIDNGGSARSQGVELAIQSRPLDGLTIAAWAAWNEAELSENLPENATAVGVKDERLPYNARFSGKLSVEQSFPLTNSLNGFIGAEVSYVGDRFASFMSAGELAVYGGRFELPAYARTDLRTGVEYESWIVNLFVNNLTDRRGILARGIDAGPPYSVSYIQPRTIGLSLVKTF